MPAHRCKIQSGWSGFGWTTFQLNDIHHYYMYYINCYLVCGCGCLSYQRVFFVELYKCLTSSLLELILMTLHLPLCMVAKYETTPSMQMSYNRKNCTLKHQWVCLMNN